MNILVRLQPKMGDTIMAFPFLDLLHEQYPEAVIDLIIHKPFVELSKFKPYIHTCYPFIKGEYKGIRGLYRFGRMIRKKKKYDLFFTLLLTFSATLIGFFAGCAVRVGYKTEGQGIVLTHSYKLPDGLHFVERYVLLLSLFTGKKLEIPPVKISIDETVNPALPLGKNMIFNVNSAVQSRRLPVEKAKSLIRDIMEKYEFNIIFIGSPGEVDYVKKIEEEFAGNPRIYNLTGKTTFSELAILLKKSDMVITADSGNAHFANALGARLVILWGGCGIEDDTRPYNKERTIILKENLPCAPCWPADTCKFGDPLCLVNTENKRIFTAIDDLMQ